MKPWAMLAKNFDDVEYIHYPVIIQPKLNGIRAKWDGENLISRQNKVWKRNTLPKIFEHLTSWSKCFPGVVLDGELYIHGWPFQDIEKLAAINRQVPAEYSDLLEFHAFDIISSEFSEVRQEKLAKIYKPYVPIGLAKSDAQVQEWLRVFVNSGFEGAMLRSLNCPYVVGRSECLIKLKPWRRGIGTIVGFKEGKGKYKGTLGALEMQSGQITFSVSGGLSDEQRSVIWNNKNYYIGNTMSYKCREYSKDGKPLQPQLD